TALSCAAARRAASRQSEAPLGAGPAARPCVGCDRELARPCICHSCRKAQIARLATAPPLGGGRLPQAPTAAPLRAQSDIALPKASPTRERGADGCHRLRWLTRAPSRVRFMQGEIRPIENVQPAEGKGAAGGNP